MAKLLFIPATASTFTAADQKLTLEDIPADVRQDMEEAYELLKSQKGRLRAAFENEVEAKNYVILAKAYCRLRPAGEIRFRVSPTRGQEKNVVDFRVTDVVTKEEAQTEEIREAAENAKK